MKKFIPSTKIRVSVLTTDGTRRMVSVKSHALIAYHKASGLSLHRFQGNHYAIFASGTGNRLPIVGTITEKRALVIFFDMVNFELAIMEEEENDLA